ncbi:MAG: hypothetical protein Q7R93_00555 [bacterium]|nr:hypothetical protein [bacterium]
MNKSHLVLGVLAAAVLVIGVSLTRSSESTTDGADLSASAAATQSSLTQAAVVSYTGNGFSPAVVKIVRGGSINFVNNSGKALRLAPLQDPKDGTSAYLGFAATKSIGRGESFGVSLTQPGIWGYKNLQDPNIVGVVIVE